MALAAAALVPEHPVLGEDGHEIVAEIRLPGTPSTSKQQPEADWSKISYSEQYDRLKAAGKLDAREKVPKPCKAAQKAEPGAQRVWLSPVYAVSKRAALLGRRYRPDDLVFAGFMVLVHGLALLAPATFSWPMVALFMVTWFVTGCLGITLSYHRQLSHKSFETPKWLEYGLAYCGVLAVQMSPVEWVSKHRYHHLHTDTPLDAHSPFEGFWWSHMGWMMDREATEERMHDRNNAGDLLRQPYYQWLQRTYRLHVVGQLAALYVLGGLPALVWGGALRLVWVYHITFGINSFCHLWGYQSYATGDLSRNLPWMGLLAWGEGWHNNHHAFGYSARHGLEWWEFDLTWIIIRSLQAVGLAWNVRLPTDKARERLRLQPKRAAGAAGDAAAAVQKQQ